MLKLFYTATFLLFCSLATFSQQPAQTRSDLEKERAEIQQQIEDVKQSLNETKRNKKETLGQLSLLQRKLRLREAAIRNINAQVNLIQGDMNQSWRDILSLRKELDTLKVQYEESVIYAYKNRSNYDLLDFIFSATNFNDVIKRIAYLKSYRAYREERAQNIVRTQALLQNKIDGLKVKREEKDVVLKKQNREISALEDEKREKNEFVANLKSRERELQKDLKVKTRQNIKIENAIRAAILRAKNNAIAEEKKRMSENVGKPNLKKEDNNSTNAAAISPGTVSSPSSKRNSVFNTTPEGMIISANFERNKGRLPWPVEAGNVSIPFGPYIIPGINVKGNSPGITIETRVGSTVKAIFDGEVSSVFNIEGTSVVLIRHGKYFSSYSNLASVNVSKGEAVKAGQTVGKAGENADGSGEIQLIIMNDESRNMNPEQWLRRR
ncbi:MAG: peptidoglycan DD-metalloendopeptidase family protein [Bacteroidetes bacterium]|nr:peptidoglycan DD-metalloendopeptidase family protein [Bacteroidota bacterium]MBS1974863.1 peptidoglycan DD-metalloendopeptidase family protein [Bacteroidota bacterium]